MKSNLLLGGEFQKDLENGEKGKISNKNNVYPS